MAIWTVVQFEDNSVESVPTSWIVGDQCHWPILPQPKLMNAIRKNELVNTCWPSHKVKIFRNSTFGDYATARKKTILAEETSDLASEIENLVGKRKRIQKVLSSSSSSSDEERSPIKRKHISEAIINEPGALESPPKLPTAIISACLPKLSTAPKPSARTISFINDLNMENDGKKTLVCQNECKICCNRSRDTKMLGDILNQTNIIRVITTDILKEINKKNESAGSSSQNVSIQNKFPSILFPIQNEEEMEMFNSLLSDADNLDVTVNELSKMGGSNNYNFVKRALTAILSNSQAKKFSFHGRNGKIPFKNHLLCKAILIAADRANLANNEAQTEGSIKSWLKRSTEREKAVNKKF